MPSEHSTEGAAASPDTTQLRDNAVPGSPGSAPRRRKATRNDLATAGSRGADASGSTGLVPAVPRPGRAEQ